MSTLERSKPTATAASVAPQTSGDRVGIKLWLVPKVVEPRADKLLADIRRIVREEIRAERDVRSWITASKWMTQEQACEYLQMSRTAIYERRKMRKLAKSQDERDRAFAADHGTGTALRFHRDELDAWLARLTEI